MTQAIAYIRISTKDQSNFSISGQQEYIQQYCQRKGISLVNAFIDNGQSAKNFDRADWKRLETFVKENRGRINHLIVCKYDRFSRNVSEGLAMIDKLEKRHGITILSVMEEISVSPDSPFFFKMRTDMLVQAEFELRVIRDRTRAGVMQAKREGRWINRAPIGYLNARDEKNKPILITDPEKSLIIKRVFDLVASGQSMGQAKAEAVKMGLSHSSSSAMSRILQNPAYLGMVPMGEALLPGKHEALIDMATFNQVQAIFRKETKVRVLINDEVPLRGVLRCSCGRLLTAGRSKGKTRHYWYYKCESHLQVNLNATKLHEKFNAVMFDLSISPQEIDAIRKRSEQIIRERLKNKQDNVPGIKKQIASLEDQLSSLEEKFIANQVDFIVYSRWNAAYNTELNKARRDLDVAMNGEENIWARYAGAAAKLSNLQSQYEILDTARKQQLVNLVFNRNLMYHLNSFLTYRVHDLFAPNAVRLKEKGLLVISNPSENLDETLICTRNESTLELFQLLEAV